MRESLRAAMVLGVLSGIRSSAGLAALTRWPSIPDDSLFQSSTFRKVLWAALAGETLADKSGLLPPRTDALPWAGRTLLGGTAAMIAARWLGSPRSAAILVGSGSAAASTWLATSARAALGSSGVPDLLLALGEDLIVTRLVRVVKSQDEEETR